MIERGRRSITDRGTLGHISRTLAIPPQVLGITGSDDADFAAMLFSFTASVIRLEVRPCASARNPSCLPLITALF
jgi:hypothetical protein